MLYFNFQTGGRLWATRGDPLMGVGTGGAEGAAAPPIFGIREQTIALAPQKFGPSALRCWTESNRLRHLRVLPLCGTFKNQKACLLYTSDAADE